MHSTLLSAEAPVTLILMVAAGLLMIRPLAHLRRSLMNTGVFYAACLAAGLDFDEEQAKARKKQGGPPQRTARDADSSSARGMR